MDTIESLQKRINANRRLLMDNLALHDIVRYNGETDAQFRERMRIQPLIARSKNEARDRVVADLKRAIAEDKAALDLLRQKEADEWLARLCAEKP